MTNHGFLSLPDLVTSKKDRDPELCKNLNVIHPIERIEVKIRVLLFLSAEKLIRKRIRIANQQWLIFVAEAVVKTLFLSALLSN